MPKWNPIHDLNITERQGLPELRPLFSIWQEQRQKIKGSEAEQQFQEKLKREWAIETGIIENLYSLDRGTTRTLIEHGIQASYIAHDGSDKAPQWVASILQDQKQALEFVFDFVGENRSLTTSYIKELHQLLTRNQPTTDAVDPFGRSVEVELLRGQWKVLPNNPTRTDGELHEYCPPEHVISEIDQLLRHHQEHLASGIPAEVESAWLHHRFTQIHPFQDGNGRMARCLASLIFIKAGGFPLVITRDHRNDYISALEQADFGDLTALVTLFGKVEKHWFIKALSISEGLLSHKTAVRQILQAASKRIEERVQAVSERQGQVFHVAEQARQRIETKLRDTMKTLQQELGNLGKLKVRVNTSEEGKEHWFRGQIVEIARSLDYYADFQSYAHWVRLQISNGDQTDIVVSLHSVGARFSGVVGISAFLQVKSPSADNISHLQDPIAICEDVFQLNYLESWEDVSTRLEAWLDGVLVTALDQWQKGL